MKAIHVSRSAAIGFQFSIQLIFCAVFVLSSLAADRPVINSLVLQNNNLVISASIPAGFKHAVLEAGTSVVQSQREALVAGGLDGTPSIVTFRVPRSELVLFLTVRVGAEDMVPPSVHSGAPFFSVSPIGGEGDLLTEEEKIGHLLNRIAYGPSAEDVQLVRNLSMQGYIEQQLQPESIDESSNSRLMSREALLFNTYQPGKDSKLIQAGDVWRYFKGTQEPPVAWKQLGFEESSWLKGPTGIGYGDDDDATVLDDMRQIDGKPGYLSVYLRKTFSIPDLAAIDNLILKIDYDDGFVAYLNGIEIARTNATGSPPAFNQAASGDHEAGQSVEFDLSTKKSLLQPGENILGIQVHNINVTSSDLSVIPELISREFLPGPAQKRIKGINELQQLVHIRGAYSKRQLQAVLAEFWENHLTTDYDKVASYFADLKNSDAQTAMSETQAAAEAAQVEYLEHQFFHDNALGNFGDLLLFSATSPSQLIYLDNVLNVKEAPNENYAREILELFAFGVDNRYTQQDIEALARCFTGWTVRKVWPNEKQPYPASARTPPLNESVQVIDTAILEVGPGWKYFKGTQEPTPSANGGATTLWTQPEYSDSTWLPGATGIGYGDDDDATVLTDMQNKYLSVYLRRAFTIADPSILENLFLTAAYDDGFVAYLNGTEIARSVTMNGAGTPPLFNRPANGGHEASAATESFNLKNHLSLLRPAPAQNVLAIQVHNVTLDSSDLSMHPRLVQRQTLPGSIENGDGNGAWTFRFNPQEHDTEAKTLFKNTPNEINIPKGRIGLEGLKDATDVIDAMVNHPSVSEFICLKLVNKFVSDEIGLVSFHANTAPLALRQLVNDAIAAWHSTVPAGNIRTVMRVILNPSTQNNYFWAGSAYRSKAKTPLEFINSSLRALNAEVTGNNLPGLNDQLGMHLFTRDEPDGWSELGFDWIDTGTMLERIKFAQALAENRNNNLRWDASGFLTNNQLNSAEAIVNYFNELLFQGKLSSNTRALLIEFVTTDDQGNPLILDRARTDYVRRVQELIGLILSMPQWHYQ